MSHGGDLVASGEIAKHPSIHIWNSCTLHNVGVIKGIHRFGVQHLLFIQSDKLLLTCGIRQNVPILIYSVDNCQLVISTCLMNSQLVDVAPIVNYLGELVQGQSVIQSKQSGKQLQPVEAKPSVSPQLPLRTPPLLQAQLQGKQGSLDKIKFLVQAPAVDYSSSFVLFCSKSIQSIEFRNGELIQRQIMIDKYYIEGEILCGAAMVVNYENPYLRAYSQPKHRSLVFLTGHSNGCVYVWKDYELEAQRVKKFTATVINIKLYEHGIIVSTEASVIELWDLAFQTVIKTIEITSFPFKVAPLPRRAQASRRQAPLAQASRRQAPASASTC